MLAFVGFDERDRSRQKLNDYEANLTGELFNLPGGPVGVALGYEHRYQFGSFTPDPVIQAGLGADIPAQAASGSFSVDEVYGELRAPLLKDRPFFRSLELNGAARYSNYSSFGGNTTLTGGALWKPVTDLLLRGSYAQSLRAPSIGELYGARSRFDQPLSDPCTNELRSYRWRDRSADGRAAPWPWLLTLHRGLPIAVGCSPRSARLYPLRLAPNVVAYPCCPVSPGGEA